MRTQEITLPSGLSGEMRKFKAGDWHLLVDPAYSRNLFTTLMATLAGRIWLKTINKGPYAFDETPPFGGGVLIGDRQYLLMKCRAFTSRTGGRRPIRIRCPGCNSWFDWIIDFNDLPIQRLSEEAAAQFMSGKPFETHLEAGPVVKWELATGTNYEERIMALAAKHGGSQQAETAGRIVDVVGVEFNKMNKSERLDQIFEWVCELDEEDYRDLVEDIEANECGIDNAIPVRCADPQCDMRFNHEADVLGFILPEARQRSRSSRSTTSAPMTSGNELSG